MLRLFISDINDFERVKTYKMIKNITKFDLRETINEVIMMQDFDALKKEIKIECQFHRLKCFSLKSYSDLKFKKR